MTDAVAIIPARGGSKGIPKKNLRRVAGKPLVCYSIDAALEAETLGRVYVSTDDEEIAEVSRAAGAEVIRRPDELSGDFASSEAALLHTLKTMEADGNSLPELTVFLQCTSPLTTAADIDGTVRALIDGEADCSLAVTPFHHFLWRQDEDGAVNGLNHNSSSRKMRQELQPDYLETGAVYVMRTEGFRAAGHRFFGKIVPHVMPSERCLEIDDPVELAVAETLVRAQKQECQAGLLPDTIKALVLDFDGVFTDNCAIIHQDGTESVRVSRSDGMWLSKLAKTNIKRLVLSSEKNPVVAARCSKLGIECIHGADDKGILLKSWLDKHNIDPADVVYVGNAENDVPCLRIVGFAVVVNDAEPEALKYAQIVLRAKGGQGAIAEICQLLINRERN